MDSSPLSTSNNSSDIDILKINICWTLTAEQGLPKEPVPAEPDLATQSELNLDSSSLREAAFQKWIAKKKENNTFKKADLVTVIDDKEDMPSAEEIRQVKIVSF